MFELHEVSAIYMDEYLWNFFRLPSGVIKDNSCLRGDTRLLLLTTSTPALPALQPAERAAGGVLTSLPLEVVLFILAEDCST